MCKKIISHVMIFSILLTGCYSWEVVQEPEPDSKIRITTKDQIVYEMSAWEDKNGQIIGDAGETKREGRFTKKLQTKIFKEDIDKVEEKYLNGVKTTLCVVGIFAGIIVIAGLTTNWNSNFLSNSRL